jgi:CheY-like chemotaxis protein
MRLEHLNVLLADDDKDDCFLFKEVLEELPLSTTLAVVNDGEQLMQQLLEEQNGLPHVLFLDLNMPRKNGFECLSEIRFHSHLNPITIIIFSTSYEQGTVNKLYKNGAHYYIRKPAEFCKLKNVIHQALILSSEGNISQPDPDHFVLKGDTMPS